MGAAAEDKGLIGVARRTARVESSWLDGGFLGLMRREGEIRDAVRKRRALENAPSPREALVLVTACQVWLSGRKELRNQN